MPRKTQTKGVISDFWSPVDSIGVPKPDLSEAKDLNHATPCQPSLVEILRPSSSDGLRMTPKGGRAFPGPYRREKSGLKPACGRQAGVNLQALRRPPRREAATP